MRRGDDVSTIFFTSSPRLLVDYGAAATAVQKKACRAAAAYAAFAAAAAASAVLLLSWCFCHIGVPLLRVPKEIPLCPVM